MLGFAALLLSVLTALPAGAQALSIQGDKFAVDGVPKFLTFISFFGAMGAANIEADLRFLKASGFDGVRIWPCLFTGPQLMRGDGSLNPDGLARLRYVLDRARAERLIVDVSFTGEHISGLDAGRFKDGIVATTVALREYENVLFDIENERNVYGPAGRPLGASDVASIYAGIKAVHPERITTASNSSLITDEAAAKFVADLGLDVTAYHDPREFNWFEMERLEPMVRILTANGRPAYLQEPMPTRGDPRFPYYPQTDRPDYFLKAVANAKRAGAAAWCFHTNVGSDLRAAGSFIEDRLRAFPDVEWGFVTAFAASRINLQTNNGLNYLTADGGGGGDVRATARTAGSFETFTLTILGGGPLVDGDRLLLRTSDGQHYVQAVGGGGATLRASGSTPGTWETFIIEKPQGGGIWPGDEVRLRAPAVSWYVVADGGGGSSVSVTRPSAGPWETFRIVFGR
jgi:hypothetical protein